MKAILFMAALCLCSCAVGSTDPETDPAAETGTYSAPPRQSPPPSSADDSPSTDSNCFTQSEWVNDCLVLELICDNQLKRIDVKCSSGRILFPWEYIPDPPPPWVDGSKKD